MKFFEKCFQNIDLQYKCLTSTQFYIFELLKLQRQRFYCLKMSKLRRILNFLISYFNQKVNVRGIIEFN